MKRSAIAITLFIVCSVLALSTQGHAINGPLLDGQGARVMGMGATNIAVTNDSNAIANNPGAIFAHDAGVVNVEVGILNPHTKFKNNLNDEDGENLLCAAPSAGFLTTPLGGKIKLGFGLFSTGGLASEFRLTNDLYGDQVYESDLCFMKLLPAIGYKVNEKLSIGLTLGAGYQTLRLKMPYQVHSGALAGNVMVADLRMEGMSYCGSLGILYKVNDAVRIGFVYKSATEIDLSGDANIDASALGAGTAKYDLDATYEWPQTAGFGLSYQATPRWLFGVDLEWINWKKAMDTLEIKFSKGNSESLPTALDDNLPLNWDDQYVVRLGGEYKATDKLTLRSGISYGKSPIPDNTVMPVLCTLTEWSATIGLGYHFTEDVSFNAAYLHSFEHTQDTDVSLIGDEYNGSSTSMALDGIYMGLAVMF